MVILWSVHSRELPFQIRVQQDGRSRYGRAMTVLGITFLSSGVQDLQFTCVDRFSSLPIRKVLTFVMIVSRISKGNVSTRWS